MAGCNPPYAIRDVLTNSAPTSAQLLLSEPHVGYFAHIKILRFWMAEVETGYGYAQYQGQGFGDEHDDAFALHLLEHIRRKVCSGQSS